jgi:hypothetical protein
MGWVKEKIKIMNFKYIENFEKTSVDNMELVQIALKETGAVVDTKLFPLIEEAEKGTYEIMAELFEMFCYGDNDIHPNYEMAKRYAEKLHQQNLEMGDHLITAQGLEAIAVMHNSFNNVSASSDYLLECFKYMVKNLPPEQWIKQVIKVVADNLEDYQDKEE